MQLDSLGEFIQESICKIIELITATSGGVGSGGAIFLPKKKIRCKI